MYLDKSVLDKHHSSCSENDDFQLRNIRQQK